MSGSERRAYTRELLELEPEDMRLTTAEVLNYKKEMQVFSKAIAYKGKKEKMWGYITFFGGPLVFTAISLSADVIEVLYVGLPLSMAAGAAIYVKGLIDTSRSMTLSDKSRLLIAQSTSYPIRFDSGDVRLAFGVSSSFNPCNGFTSFGPGLSISF